MSTGRQRNYRNPHVMDLLNSRKYEMTTKERAAMRRKIIILEGAPA